MMRHPRRLAFLMKLCSLFAIFSSGYLVAEDQVSGDPNDSIRILSFDPQKPMNRAQRPAGMVAILLNEAIDPVEVEIRFIIPDGVTLLAGSLRQAVVLEPSEEREINWQVQSDHQGPAAFKLELTSKACRLTEANLSIDFLAPLEKRQLDFIPDPQPVKTDILVGAHNCPLWESDRFSMWTQILKHPERTPALGFYGQENPEVADWETKWAVEHGVSFFIYCWYRASQGEPVKMNFGSAIHEAFLKSRFVDRMKFTIMWENQSRGTSGVSDEKDLMDNLLPFWMENYFRHPSYLKIDNKPLLFVYRPEFLVEDLGGVEQVRAAFEKMRQACREAGFDGLYLLGEYRGLDPKHLQHMKDLGLDYTFAYCWHVPDNPTPAQAISAQLDSIRKTQALGILPQVVTVSQAWSGWADEGTIWKIPPADFKTLLQQAKQIITTFPGNELGSRLLLLDNWNEWGEGHYIAPYREYGFGYLDAVREVFSDAPEPHIDLLPEDIGLGPYDGAYQKHSAQQKEIRPQVAVKKLKPGAPEQGLIGWWAFDEEQGSPYAWDCSGNRLGGIVHQASRVQGLDGLALDCRGGCVEVIPARRLSPAAALTVMCWVYTDLPGQDNHWLVNRVFAGGTATGYRLGILQGKPCFEVPLTDWSHHLKADRDLPAGQWVHLAGTFDGNMQRIYVDGVERGSLSRPGAPNPNAFHLCLGSYDIDHPAFFTGLLDEVRLYDRALTAQEIDRHFQALAGKAREMLPAGR